MAETNAGTPSATTQVDPEALRTFANRLDTEAGAVTGLDTGSALTTAVTALPGTQFGPAMQRAADLTASGMGRVADRLSTVADTLRNNAGSYEMTEAQFSDALTTVGLDIPA